MSTNSALEGSLRVDKPPRRIASSMVRAISTIKSHPLVALEVTILVGLLAVSAISPLLPLPSPNVGDLADGLIPPLSPGHGLGTDLQGRDIMVRVIYGLRTTVGISVAVTLLVVALGTTLAVISGFYRRTDGLIMRIVDIQLAFPSIVLAIALVAALGGGSVPNVIIVLTVAGWVPYARVGRSKVLSIKASSYIEASRSIGSRDLSILTSHILPNVLPTMIAMAVADFPMIMIQAASLDYLGLGVPSSTVTLGVMVREGQDQMFSAWWVAVFPALVMAIVVLLATSIGDAIARHVNR